MKARFLKVISLPVFLVVMIPMIIICSIIWILTEKYHPMDVTGKYFKWLED